MKFQILLFLTFITIHSFSGPNSIYPSTNDIINILNNEESKYKGQDGLKTFTTLYFQGDMKKTYLFTTEAMGIEVIRLMEWESLLGKNSFLQRQASNKLASVYVVNQTQKDTRVLLLENAPGEEERKLRLASIGIKEFEERIKANKKAKIEAPSELEEEMRQLRENSKSDHPLEKRMKSNYELNREIEVKRNLYELQLMREIIEISDGEIDYLKWSGLDTGLHNAANEYLLRIGRSLPYKRSEQMKVRFRLRTEAISKTEALKLAWGNSLKLFGESTKRLRNRHTPSQKVISIENATKKGRRR